MSDIHIRKEGRAGRITLTRPKALNALTHAMSDAIAEALELWRADDEVALIVIDGAGDKAFCAGGDVAEAYRQGMAGHPEVAQAFWHDEYHMNLALAEYPKPTIGFMHGFTMGGGVGLAGHLTHRIVSEDVQIAMPESTIGLVTDVGGTLSLAGAPGRLGDYLLATSARMGPGDALHTGFADLFIPRADWPALIAEICETGSSAPLMTASEPAPASPLAAQALEIERFFKADTLSDVLAALEADDSEFAAETAKAMRARDPLAMAASRLLTAKARQHQSLKEALAGEYRFSYRALQEGDFLEGVRARLIDKDNAPRWKQGFEGAEKAAGALIAPLGDSELWSQS